MMSLHPVLRVLRHSFWKNKAFWGAEFCALVWRVLSVLSYWSSICARLRLVVVHLTSSVF